jgi:hypothetical protein
MAERFIAGVSRHSPATADVTKPARPAQTATTSAPAAEPVAVQVTSPAPAPGDFFCSPTRPQPRSRKPPS